MLGAASALDARVSLQRDQLRDVGAGIESEILIAGERRNPAEPVSLEKNRHRTQDQVQMLGARDQRQKDQQRQRVRPPVRPSGALPSSTAKVYRYVAIRMKISSAMNADSIDTCGPSQIGRSTTRRNASPAIETATRIANSATK